MQIKFLSEESEKGCSDMQLARLSANSLSVDMTEKGNKVILRSIENSNTGKLDLKEKNCNKGKFKLKGKKSENYEKEWRNKKHLITNKEE